MCELYSFCPAVCKLWSECHKALRVVDECRTAERRQDDNLYIWDKKTNGWFSGCGFNLCSCLFLLLVFPDWFPGFSLPSNLYPAFSHLRVLGAISFTSSWIYSVSPPTPFSLGFSPLAVQLCACPLSLSLYYSVFFGSLSSPLRYTYFLPFLSCISLRIFNLCSDRFSPSGKKKCFTIKTLIIYIISSSCLPLFFPLLLSPVWVL